MNATNISDIALGLDRTTVVEARRISQRIKPSRKWKHLRQSAEGGMDGCPCYENDLYRVTVRRYMDGWTLDKTQPWVQLGIYCIDGEPRHDFRVFQNIKNDICGPEWEAIELYPAESRLADPSNYFMLWCAPKIPIGLFNGRAIMGPHNCIAPQRGWEKGSEPQELKGK